MYSKDELREEAKRAYQEIIEEQGSETIRQVKNLKAQGKINDEVSFMQHLVDTKPLTIEDGLSNYNPAEAGQPELIEKDSAVTAANLGERLSEELHSLAEETDQTPSGDELKDKLSKALNGEE